MLRRISRFLQWLESATLVALFLSLLIVAVAQVILRNLGSASSSLPWGDELVQTAILWITLVGAMLAVRNNDHIRIDLLERFVAPRWHRLASMIANFCAACVCIVVALFSTEFVWLEYQFPSASGIGVIPLWLLVVIVPFTFFVMGVQFAINIFLYSKE